MQAVTSAGVASMVGERLTKRLLQKKGKPTGFSNPAVFVHRSPKNPLHLASYVNRHSTTFAELVNSSFIESFVPHSTHHTTAEPFRSLCKFFYIIKDSRTISVPLEYYEPPNNGTC